MLTQHPVKKEKKKKSCITQCQIDCRLFTIGIAALDINNVQESPSPPFLSSHVPQRVQLIGRVHFFCGSHDLGQKMTAATWLSRRREKRYLCAI